MAIEGELEGVGSQSVVVRSAAEARRYGSTAGWSGAGSLMGGGWQRRQEEGRGNGGATVMVAAAGRGCGGGAKGRR